jgi:import inner membrane translocase subunit TIM54
VRGMHEGWLGPLDPPTAPTELTPADFPVPQIEESAPQPTPVPGTPGAEPVVVHATDDASPQSLPDTPMPEEGEKAKEEEKPKKKRQPPPFIKPTEYENATVSPNCPQALGPAAVVPFPHLLGFFNFPIRMYRFLNRRQVADDIGRQTAAAVLGAYRPFEVAGETANLSGDDEGSSAQWEQQRLLAHEESDYHKTARDRSKDEEGKERVWLDDMVLDPRIAERMRRFVIDAETEERANSLSADPKESWFSSLWPKEQKKGAWEGLSDD